MLSTYEDIKYCKYEAEFTATTYRICIVPKVEYKTSRFVLFKYFIPSERHSFIRTPIFRYNERRIFLHYSLGTYKTERFARTIGKGLYNERNCKFIHNLIIRIFDLDLKIPIVKYDKRYCKIIYAHTDFRYCVFPITIHNERHVKLSINRKVELFDLDVIKPLIKLSEINCYVEYAHTDFRYVKLKTEYSNYTERFLRVFPYRKLEIYDLELNKPLYGYSEKFIKIPNVVSPYSERIVKLNDFFDFRYVKLSGTYETYSSEVFCHFINYLKGSLYDMLMISAIPEVSERFCKAPAFVYNSERKIYVETKPIYVYKRYSSNYPDIFAIPLDHNVAKYQIYSYSSPDEILSIGYVDNSVYYYDFGKIYILYPYSMDFFDLIIFTDRGEILTHSEDNVILENVGSIKMSLKVRK